MDIEIIRKRICESLLNPDIDVTEIAEDLEEQGEFKSIDYNSRENQVWHPIKHLENVQKMQIALHSNGNRFFNDSDLREKITRAMKYWNEKKYHCDWNNWFNNIGIGKYIPDILLFGIEGFTKQDNEQLIKNYKPTLLQYEKIKKKVYEREVDSIGANLLDQVLSTMKIAVLENDAQTMDFIKRVMENELRFFPAFKKPMFPYDAEGIKSDWSFLQHFQMIYFGGYGEVFVEDMTKYLSYTKDTKYALSDRAINFYTNFLLEGMQFAVRNGYRDFNASGRGATRVDGLRGIADVLKDTAQELLEYDCVERRDELIAMLDKRLSGKSDVGAGGHRYFHEADYSVMNNENYCASVRHAGCRTRIYEYLNDENFYGFYSGLGGLQLCVDGDEYYNIPPVLNWNLFPGTTSRLGYVPTMDQFKSYGLYGNTKYVNGVTNKKVGCSYIKLHQKGVNAKKAYFMFDDAVVCMGTGISSLTNNQIVTNMNQTLIKGDITVGTDETRVMQLGEMAYGVFKYIHHNKIAYITASPVAITAQTAQGDWHICQNQIKSRPVFADTLTMNIYHGKRPLNDKYCYTALMNVSLADTQSYFENPYIEPIMNNSKVQAAYDKKKKILMAVFHKGAKLSYENNSVKASEKCIVIIENKDGKNIVTASSSDCENKNVVLEINKKRVKLELDRTSRKFEI